ncbi:holo-ACP synthase [Treponema pedis]|uniref:Holo-[acyl-carrier-protein] synthase n=2 Tax=Treponema pedis TaxID=409322 RepID=S6A4Q8_9SPIR|nr:holo-ACP synthase [Treponema pedis]AGT44671.1 holo-ACP synthase [Treponema pedis str. T A4]QOW59993.1 holo-ACP synthase [Treponema pedis]
MILGVGIDIVNVDRIKSWLTVKGLPERFFNSSELETSFKRGEGQALSLAARFAAKEAFGKAMGTGLKGMKLKDISVINTDSGKPELRLFGSALTIFKKSGAEKIHLSLSHEKNTAAAIVVIEGK